MKQFRPVLICAAVLLVISLVAFVAIKFIPEKEPSQNPTGNFELSDSIEIISLENEEIASIEITSDDGECFAIDYSGSGVHRTAKLRNASAGLAYAEDQMIVFCQYLTPLVALDEIGTGADSDFGFDTPRRKISIYSTSGETQTLLVGDDLPVGDGAYVRRADAEEVYSVGPTVRGILLKKAADYREVQLFAEISETAVITMAEYTPFGKSPIKIVLRSDEEIKKDEERLSIAIPYKLISPVTANTDPGAVEENFLGKIAGIKGSHVVEDNPKDLAKYGLLAPSRLRFETSEGLSVSLLVGKDTENGGTFVMTEGIPSVIETTEKISFRTLTHTDIIQKLLWFYSSSEVSGFDYKLADGKTYSFSLSAKDGETKGSVDGKELQGRNAQNLYMRTVRFTIAGERDKTESPKKPEVTITARLVGGETSTLSLSRLNERQYAAVVDGKDNGYYVQAAEVEDLIEALSLVARGEDIPNMF